MSTIGSSSAMDNLAALLMLAKPAPDPTPATANKPAASVPSGDETVVRVELSDLAKALLELQAEMDKGEKAGA